MRVVGRVVSIKPYGVFVRVEPEIDGLLHANDATWTGSPKELLNEISVGDDMELVVLHYDPFKRRIGLGLKQVSEVIPPDYVWEEDKTNGPCAADDAGRDPSGDEATLAAAL